ncbi:MAG: class I SAM-dependent methyltransferase [Coraliomargarita sp.]
MRNDSNKICPLCSGPGRFFYADKRRAYTYQECGYCKLVWLDPENYLNREAEHAHYAQHENDPADPNYRSFLNRLWAPVKDKLTPAASGLDYGSGPGPTLHLMAQEDGFACRHYDPCFNPDKSVFGQQYDFITCSETAEHFHDPAAEFRQLHALLKPGGWLGVMTSRLMPNIEFANWHYRREITHVMFYRDATFEWMSGHWAWAKPEFVSNSVVLLQKI